MATNELIFKYTINAMKLQTEQLVTQRRDTEENVTAVREVETETEMRRRNWELTSKLTELENVMKKMNR